MNFSYPKKEKLCSKRIIEKLFETEKPIYEFPLKLFWMIHELPEDVPVQSLVTVSKRRFKRAVKRNLLKRRMREAFRLNKNPLYSKIKLQNVQLAIMIIYNHGELLPFQKIESAMIKAFDKLTKKVEEASKKKS